ncbi:segregation and condensation protein A [Candidatus Margulisiibacteriota bacterium]
MTEELAYQVDIDAYKGPFDLLLKAIDEGEIDIHKVYICKIVDSYVSYWRREEPDLVLASDFLYMAAYLIELKSRSLLPAREGLLEDENLLAVEEDLVSHLQEYEVFKNLAQTLRQRKEVFEKVYGRHEGEPEEHEIELVDVSLKDLVLAFKKAYDEAAKRERIVPIKAEEITIEDRIEEISKLLAERIEGVAFGDLFVRGTRVEVIVTFLAILELAKQRLIKIGQDARFGSIMIVGRKEYESTHG